MRRRRILKHERTEFSDSMEAHDEQLEAKLTPSELRELEAMEELSGLRGGLPGPLEGESPDPVYDCFCLGILNPAKAVGRAIFTGAALLSLAGEGG